MAAFRDRRTAWVVVSFATLMALNAVLHAIATPLLGVYSPGTATALLLYLPLSFAVLRSSVDCLPRHQVAGAAVAGFLLHGLVTLVVLT